MYRTVFLIFCAAEVFLKAKGTDTELDAKEVTVTVVEGRTAILPCPVENLGVHKVIWLNPRRVLLSLNQDRIIDDQRLSIERPYRRDWNLHIRNVLQSDSGEYMCQINTNPIRIKTVHLEVKVPSKLQTSSEDQTINEGESLQLFCKMTGVPKPDIVWSKVPDNTFDDTGNGFEHTGEILMIENVSRTDQGTYRCLGYNGVEPSLSHSIKVIVDFPPVVFTPVERIKQYYGKDTILSCDITARPFAEMSWFKNDRRPIPVFASKYRTDIYHKNANTITTHMRIKDLSADDFGRYTCYAGNHLGEDEAYVELEAIGTDPELDEKEVNVTVVEGSTVILPCRIEGSGDYQVSWTDNNKTLLTLDDRRIIDDYRISVEQQNVFDWNLQIRSVLYSDQGQYTCQMNTSPVQFVNLEVKVPTKLETSSEDQTINEGESLQLFCKMTGVPKPDIVWSNVSGNASDDNGNGFEHTGEVLVIENVARTDQGTYRCRGYNGVGTAVSQSIKVIVHFPPVVSTPVKRIMQYPGKEVILSCDINANPIAVSYWLKNDKRMIFSQSSNFLADDTNTMTISVKIKDLNANDFGRYTCYAYNQLGKSEAHVELKAIDTDPALDVKKVNVTVVEGSTAILPCSIVNLGNHKVVWTDHYSTLLTYNDRRIIDDSRISIERPYTPNWDLQIRDVLYSDRGRYTCQINTFPVISKFVNLEVTAIGTDPELDEKEVNVTVVEGSTVILPCRIEGSGDYQVSWTDNNKTLLTLDDRRIIDDYRISVEQQNVFDWNLQIRSVLYSDQGQYTCQMNTSPVQFVNLEVKVPTKLETSSEDQTINEGESLQLFCKMTGVPKPDIVWSNVSGNASDDNGNGFEHTGEVLVIENVARTDQGTYRCRGYNGVGTAVSQSIKVIVHFPPVVSTPVKRIMQYPGKEVILSCDINANPFAVSYWLKNGKRRIFSQSWNSLVDDTNTMTISVRIKYLNANDFGRYTCYAHNRLGKSEAHVELKAIGTDPALDVKKVNVTVVEGSTAILTCSIVNLGNNTVVWTDHYSTLLTYNDRRIIDDSRISIERPYTPNWDLQIRDVLYSDRGRYTCQINTFPVISKFVNLEVTAIGTDPELDEKEVNVTVVEGSTVILPCRIEGSGDYQVSWTDNNKTLLTLDDRRIIDDYRISVEQQNVFDWNLQIRSVLYSDQGQYTCQMNTSPVQFVNLEVKVPTKLETSSEDQTINEGESLQLFCKMTGVPKPDIVWSNVSGNASDDNGNGFEHTGEVLVIENVARTDQGTYRCRGYNGVGTAVSQSIKVIVHFPPVVSTPVKRIMQYPGKEVILSCDINANPFAVSYWLKNGKRRIFSQSWNSLVDDTNTMTISVRIKYLNANDFGRYTCYAHNRLGKSEAHVELKAIGTDPALDVKKVNVTVVEGSTAILTCSIVNLGNNTVVWTDHYSTLLTYNDRRIIDDSRISIERPYTPNWDLQIRDVLYSDRGRYTCQINTFPVISKIVNLEVTGSGTTSEMVTEVAPVTTETQADLSVPDINENATRGSNDKPSREEVSNKMLKAIRLEYYREQIQTDRKWRSILDLQETYYRTVVKYLQKHDSASNETNMMMILTP